MGTYKPTDTKFQWGGLHFSDLLSSIMTIVNNNAYYKTTKRVDFKCSHYKKVAEARC
jgi:hypothetical protein